MTKMNVVKLIMQMVKKLDDPVQVVQDVNVIV
ncbi:unnamed protein product [Schistosoma curassoni]|uniref:Phage protein n=1 Tax=Schistosoma curassoni TaxID=6186 RepID=A0A183JTJ8_9TREM|nr:unnamed protein product [Schistosoma curassoni]